MSDEDYNIIVDVNGDEIENTWSLEAMERYQNRQEEKKKKAEDVTRPKTPEDYFLKGNKRTYKSSFVHSYKIRDKQLSYSFIENVFETEVLQENMDRIDIRINVTSNNILFGLQFIPDNFKDLFLKLADIKNEMCFRISKRNCEITDLLNYDELSQKWKDIKADIAKNDALRNIKAEELQQIMEAGDKEYLSGKDVVLSEMKNLFVYRTFFNSFMQFSDDTTMLNHTLRSNIAPDVEVPLKLTLTREIKNERDKFLCYTIDGQNEHFNEKQIKKTFQSQFKILKELYDSYAHNYFSLIEIDTSTNWLISVNCSTKEVVNNGSLTAEIICNIEDITDETDGKEEKL